MTWKILSRQAESSRRLRCRISSCSLRWPLSTCMPKASLTGPEKKLPQPHLLLSSLSMNQEIFQGSEAFQHSAAARSDHLQRLESHHYQRLRPEGQSVRLWFLPRGSAGLLHPDPVRDPPLHGPRGHPQRGEVQLSGGHVLARGHSPRAGDQGGGDGPQGCVR